MEHHQGWKSGRHLWADEHHLSPIGRCPLGRVCTVRSPSNPVSFQFCLEIPHILSLSLSLAPINMCVLHLAWLVLVSSLTFSRALLSR